MNDTETLQKELDAALETYLSAREALDGLNPFSPFDLEVRQPVLLAELRTTAAKLAFQAEELLVAMADF